jgi:hypothetical protein
LSALIDWISRWLTGVEMAGAAEIDWVDDLLMEKLRPLFPKSTELSKRMGKNQPQRAHGTDRLWTAIEKGPR